jgi:hypothetical protein
MKVQHHQPTSLSLKSSFDASNKREHQPMANPKTQIEGTIPYNPIESWGVLGIEKYEAPFFPRGPWLQGQCWSQEVPRSKNNTRRQGGQINSEIARRRDNYASQNIAAQKNK